MNQGEQFLWESGTEVAPDDTNSSVVKVQGAHMTVRFGLSTTQGLLLSKMRSPGSLPPSVDSSGGMIARGWGQDYGLSYGEWQTATPVMHAMLLSNLQTLHGERQTGTRATLACSAPCLNRGVPTSLAMCAMMLPRYFPGRACRRCGSCQGDHARKYSDHRQHAGFSVALERSHSMRAAPMHANQPYACSTSAFYADVRNHVSRSRSSEMQP